MEREKGEKGKVIDRGKAVMYLIFCDGEVLLEERPDNDKGFAGEVIIPGGKNDEGEDHKTAVEREVREETGLEGIDLTPLGNEFRAITTSGHKYLMRAYYATVDDKSRVKDMEPESGKFVWVPLADAKENQIWAHSHLVLERAEKLREES